jgi:hypothetical protein
MKRNISNTGYNQNRQRVKNQNNINGNGNVVNDGNENIINSNLEITTNYVNLAPSKRGSVFRFKFLFPWAILSVILVKLASANTAAGLSFNTFESVSIAFVGFIVISFIGVLFQAFQNGCNPAEVRNNLFVWCVYPLWIHWVIMSWLSQKLQWKK